jgi:predicted Rossmann fold flavoprotein
MSRSIGVIGAGAAGLMAAAFAARTAPEGVEVHLFEATADGGRKILISGGGRCNVLPGRERFDDYVTDSSRNSLRRILKGWPLREQREFFTTELGIELRLEPETGKLFPVSNRARDVRDALVDYARRCGAQLHFSTRVTALHAVPDGWQIEAEGFGTARFERLIVATGGLSVPKTGSDGAGLEWARALGHTVRPTYPALTPLTHVPHEHADLAGVSLDVSLRAPGTRPGFETAGGFLITHRGYSGPTVLNASHLAIRSAAAGEHQRLEVNWTDWGPDDWDRHLRETEAGTVGGVVSARLPQRLARRLVDEAGVPWDRSLARLRREERRSLVQTLTAWSLPWDGDEGYRKAEVTGGGVALEEVDPLTLESRIAPGLHLCGELLDAFGPIGGHNFFWAWVTGRGAGRGAGEGMAARDTSPDAGDDVAGAYG